MTRDEVAARIGRALEAFRRRDAQGVADEHAPDCVMESPTAGGPVNGRAAIAEVYDTWFKGFPDLTFTQEDLVIEGGRFAQLLMISGTDTGGFLKLPPTGKPFRVPIVLLGRVNEDGIIHARAVYDFAGMLMQIGILRAKPA